MRTILLAPEHLDLQSTQQAAQNRSKNPSPEWASQPSSLAERVDAFRRRTILDAVERHDGNWAAAARELDLHRSNLHQLATRLGLRVQAGRK
jgi:anaerobic nitric oxide reductase transcription regulator